DLIAEASAEEAYDDVFEGFDDSLAENDEAPETTIAEKDLNKELMEAVTNKKKDREAKRDKNKKQHHGEEADDILTESNLSALANMADTEIDMSEWAALELSPQVLSAIANLKFSEPTAIQSAAIPHILAGHDVIGKASTGSGKTLAFAIPIVEKWLADRED